MLQVCLKGSEKQKSWYLDSGCSRHMTGERSMFLTLTMKEVGPVGFGGNQTGKIIGIGTIGNSSISINNVWLVDRLRGTLRGLRHTDCIIQKHTVLKNLCMSNLMTKSLEVKLQSRMKVLQVRRVWWLLRTWSDFRVGWYFRSCNIPWCSRSCNSPWYSSCRSLWRSSRWFTASYPVQKLIQIQVFVGTKGVSQVTYWVLTITRY